jgi:hypothetical protein
MCKTYFQEINRFQIKYGENYGYGAGHNNHARECFVFLEGIQITVILILLSKTRMCRNFFLGCRTVMISTLIRDKN